MSVKAYFGLHGRMALWSSLWTQPVFVGKSRLFFFYPAVQLAVFMAGLSVGRNLFIKAADTSDLASLKTEITYLELIFINVLFIHLQTGLILVSYGLGRGVNKSYMAIVAAVIVMLVPYYHIRRRILHR